MRRARLAALAGALLQGVALVAVPAAAGEPTAGDGLSAASYGLLLLPQAAAAIAALPLAAVLRRRFGGGVTLAAGLMLDAVGIVLLAAARVLGVALALPAPGSSDRDIGAAGRGALLPGAAAALAGACGAMSAAWSGVVLRTDVRAPDPAAWAALAAFWAAVAAARLATPALLRRVSASTVLRFGPVPIAIADAGIALLHPGAVAGAITAFALSGLGCALVLPLIPALAPRVRAALVAGGGAAVAAAGALVGAGVPLTVLFGATAVVVVLLIVATGLLSERTA